jgi:hypothetical protein
LTIEAAELYTKAFSKSNTKAAAVQKKWAARGGPDRVLIEEGKQ